MKPSGIASLQALLPAVPGNLVGCGTCDATTIAPELGDPEGWDCFFQNGAGLVFTCPDCLEQIEQDWMNGRASRLGGGLPQ